MAAIRTVLFALAIFAFTASISAAPPAPLIELQLGKETLQGKVLAHNEDLCLLMGQDGRMRSVVSKNVKKFRQVSPQFSGWSGSVLRDQLRREFGKSFEVVGTRHYAVCATSDQKARVFADTFEDLFRTFQMYFSVRGFKISEPEFPLVAIVFPDYDAFARYAKAENVAVSRNLKGYYLNSSNRIALYEDAIGISARQSLPTLKFPQASVLESGAPNPFQLPLAGEGNPTPWASFEGSLKDTMIHEATHQAAFNTGLHSRIGENPKWVVEGLATVFEAPGIRNSGANIGAKMRINRERFMWFGDFAKSRRKPQSLEAFLSNDELFQSAALDAYSQAWAFTFFLIETRPRLYAEYLRTIAARDPLQAYAPAARVADFKQVVGKELPLLEAEFLRYIASIK
jgi:hypothetical protein